LEDAELRALAAEYLGGFGPAAGQAVPDLTAQLAGDPQAAEKAAWALGRIGPSARGAVPALVALLERILEEQIGCDREVVAESLGRIGVKDPPVPALLKRLARSEGQWFHPQALLALGRLGVDDDETRKLLRQGLAYDVYDDERVAYASAHALLHLGIRDQEVEGALVSAWSMEDSRLDMLRLHAGFPAEMKRILPQLVTSLSGGDLVAPLARRLAEVGPEARSALPALKEARARLLEQRAYWAQSPIDSGGSHLKGREIAEALGAVDAAIESISSAGASTSAGASRPAG
jgi:hypothetical protein